ncbi:MAG: TetR/AcrR family transcriptional regulator [Chloroflexi bacterium]|nr:TetR/AcrR family transcriptional regulator [Chloroflexota bacterium]
MNGFERRKGQKKESIRRATLELFKSVAKMVSEEVAKEAVGMHGASAELFEGYGYGKVSVNDIARKAKVSHVTIYNHFGSKEALVREVVKSFMAERLEKYTAIVEGKGTFIEKLAAIFTDKTELLSQYQGELILSAFLSDTEIKQYFEEIAQKKGNRLVLALFAQGKREGYVDPGLSDEAILCYYDILRKGIFASSRLVTGTEQSAGLMRELMFVFLYGLLGRTKLRKPIPRSERALSVN